MPPQFSEDDIDDLLYFARTGELQNFKDSINAICGRTINSLLAINDASSGNGPLHMAAANGHAEILTYIIEALAVPAPQNETQLVLLNAQNGSGNTALHWAALNGHLECVKILIDAGADPTITNAAGHDAVYEAELNDKKEVVDWVLKESEGLEMGIGIDSKEDVGEVAEDVSEYPDEACVRSQDGVCDTEVLQAGMGDLGMTEKENS